MANIDPRGTKPKDVYKTPPLHPGATEKQKTQIALGHAIGGHATGAAVVGSNPLDPEPPLKTLHTAPPSPIKAGMRNRSGE